MQQMPQIEPVTKLVRNHKELLDQAQKRPVVLTQNGHARVVVVSIEKWDEIALELQMLKAYNEYCRKKSNGLLDHYVTEEELEADIAAKERETEPNEIAFDDTIIERDF